ncbi:MAG: hypothetical protein HQK87_04445 [Nitrospinae bacterium]|nr:hypothetical protein [Nitrospinota bacterium]
MKTMDTIRRLALAALLLAAPAFLTYCGNADGGQQVSTDHVGPVGPTTPNGYYFEMTVSPQTITSGSNVSITVQVYDEQGNAAADVLVVFAGASNDPKESSVVTGVNGQGYFILQVKGPPSSYTYVTCTVEDKQLTVPVYITPGTISAA